jgi:hypothetical protein
MELRLVKWNGDFQIATNVSKLMAIWKSPFHFNACIQTLFNNCFFTLTRNMSRRSRIC